MTSITFISQNKERPRVVKELAEVRPVSTALHTYTGRLQPAHLNYSGTPIAYHAYVKIIREKVPRANRIADPACSLLLDLERGLLLIYSSLV